MFAQGIGMWELASFGCIHTLWHSSCSKRGIRLALCSQLWFSGNGEGVTGALGVGFSCLGHLKWSYRGKKRGAGDKRRIWGGFVVPQGVLGVMTWKALGEWFGSVGCTSF